MAFFAITNAISKTAATSSVASKKNYLSSNSGEHTHEEEEWESIRGSVGASPLRMRLEPERRREDRPLRSTVGRSTVKYATSLHDSIHLRKKSSVNHILAIRIYQNYLDLCHTHRAYLKRVVKTDSDSFCFRPRWADFTSNNYNEFTLWFLGKLLYFVISKRIDASL